MPDDELSEGERTALWEQFAGVYERSQESYDSSVRTLAASGVVVTVSLATALGTLEQAGLAATILFLTSLALNLGSYSSALLDMRARLNCLRVGRAEGIYGNRWSSCTTALNILAGVALIFGGVLLSVFVADNA